eukprot:364902-Chlamydomonas_euryale.AAC.22
MLWATCRSLKPHHSRHHSLPETGLSMPGMRVGHLLSGYRQNKVAHAQAPQPPPCGRCLARAVTCSTAWIQSGCVLPG